MWTNCDTKINHDDTMGRDTTYLHERSGCWYFDYRIPAQLRPLFKTDRIRTSLNTSDYKQARYLRDNVLSVENLRVV